ncbi:putative leader peptide [Streptomyces sp. NBC_01013]
MQCSIGGLRQRGQADLTKRRAVDLCRVAAMLCCTV